jgi:hypothetical protein
MTAVTTPPVPALPPVRSARARIAWTCAGLAFALAAVGITAFGVVESAAYQVITSRQRVYTVALQAVTINVESGSVTIERGAGPGTVVESSGSRGLLGPTDDEHLAGRTLVIRSSCGPAIAGEHCIRNYILRIPPQVPVAARTGNGTGSGAIVATGMDGPLDLHSVGGDITVTGGTGRLRISSDAGDVTARRLASQFVVAGSRAGDVGLGFALPPSQVTVSSRQGDITIGLPRANVSYQVYARSALHNAVIAVSNDPASRRVVHASSDGNVDVRYSPG